VSCAGGENLEVRAADAPKRLGWWGWWQDDLRMRWVKKVGGIQGRTIKMVNKQKDIKRLCNIKNKVKHTPHIISRGRGWGRKENAPVYWCAQQTWGGGVKRTWVERCVGNENLESRLSTYISA